MSNYSKEISSEMPLVAWVMLIILSILWGGSFFFVGVAVKELPFLTIVFFRVGIAALILQIVLCIMKQCIPLRKDIWIAFVWMGLLNNLIPFCLLVWGQNTLASGVASILNAMTPLCTIVVAHFLTDDERMSIPKIIGVCLGFVGVVVMIGIQNLTSISTDLLAATAILGATISYGFASVFGRKFRSMGISPIQTATGQVTASALIILPVMLWVDQPWTMALPSFWSIISVVCLAVFSTALAYILFFRILAVGGATNISLVTFFVPVSALILGVSILDEVFLLKHLIGFAFIGMGLFAIDGRLWRYLKQK